jgi:hypothetical protein
VHLNDGFADGQSQPESFTLRPNLLTSGKNSFEVFRFDPTPVSLTSIVHHAPSGARVVEINFVVALPRERESEARATKATSPTPAPGDIAVLESKARIDAHVLAPAKGNRLGRPETPGDRGHQVWDWDILPSHIRKREEVTRSFTGARFHIPRRFAWSQR